jgi:thiol:disulfide interchange protein
MPAAGTLPATAAAERRPGDGDVLARFDRFSVLATGGYAGAGDFIEFIDNAEKGVKPRGLFEGRGPAAILAIVFIGGLALNLTPCVLPMIPINLAIIGAGAKTGRRGRGFVLGSAYGAAMAVVYGVLGLVVILTAGTFGTINASPWFNVAIAALFVFLGLAMFDVFSLDFSRFSSRIRFDEQRRGTVWLAFGMGAVAALLAGACVAPVVVQVVVFASNLYAGGTAAALALPFVLGLGMALPWPIAGAGLSALPRPGAWMVRVKQVMGVFILATAAYYAYVAYGIFASRWVDPRDVQASVDAQLKAGWHSSLAEGLEVAEREGKPVLLDFWATWCKNCLVMDQTTLQDPVVLARLAGYTKIKFQAEDPAASPARELLKKVGGVGLPTYVILRPPQPAPQARP